MVSPTSAPSTSFCRDEVISGSELDHLMRTEPQSTCILDCRSGGPAIRSAYRVRLPSVLFRRLLNCSLSLSTLSPLLSDVNVKVVIVPEHGSDLTISNAVTNALRKANISYRVVKDSVETVLSSFPLLRVDNNRPSCRSSGDVGCLNLNALRIEPGIGPSTEKRQHFPVQILPHLFLGNYETASDAQLLERNGVHYIINVTSNLPNVFEGNPSFHYQRISVDDNSSHNLSHYFPEAIAFIDTAAHVGDACLVHCLAGISRSVTVCLAYLMTKNKWSLEDAYDLVLRRNASIAPNFHFMGQLIEYERHLGVRGTNVGEEVAEWLVMQCVTNHGVGSTPLVHHSTTFMKEAFVDVECKEKQFDAIAALCTVDMYPSVRPLSPSCSIQAAVTSGLLTPPPTSCSTSPQSSAHSAKSFD